MRRRLFLSSLLGGGWMLSRSAKDSIMLSHSNSGATGANGREAITLGGGCFWCVEAVYEELKGVERVESGYSGGKVAKSQLPASVHRNYRTCEVVQ